MPVAENGAAFLCLCLELIGILSVFLLETSRSVHIKDEESVGVKIVVNEREATLKLSLFCQMIKRIKRAENGSDGAVKLESRDVLQEQKNVLGAVFACYRKHFGGEVDARHIISALGKYCGENSRSASKIENKLGAFGKKFFEALLGKIRPGFIINVAVEYIINVRYCAVALCVVHITDQGEGRCGKLFPRPLRR